MAILMATLIFFPIYSHAEEPAKDLEIEWENSGGITFLVPSNQWFQFSIGINSTSLDTQAITIEINGETDWGITQSKFIIKEVELTNKDSFDLNPNEFTNITVRVFIPEIKNGLPLANIEYPFQLKVSNSTESYELWEFAISILPKYSLTIDEVIEQTTIEPLGNIVHEVKIRNTGNIQTGFITKISPIDDQGNIIGKNESNRFEESGWDATLSGWISASSLEPNESITLKITINAPYLSSSNLSISLQINSTQGGVKENITLNTSILVVKSKNINFEDTNCELLIWNNKCKLNLIITNTGNYQDYIQNSNCSTNSNYIYFNQNYSVSENDILNEILLSDKNSNSELLEPGEFKTIEFELLINSEIPKINAGTIISITCSYYSNELEIIDVNSYNFTIGEYFEIIEENLTSWIENDKLYLSIILENTGNLPESFSISMSVSHEGPHGLILLENAIYDENSSLIRVFDILDIQPQEKINVTGWMSLPNSNVEDEPFWISIEILTYSNSFENNWVENSTIKGIGSEIIPNNENNENSNFISLLNKFNKYGFSIIAGVIATIMIYQALKIRSNRNAPKEISSKNENRDWMSTFHKKSNNEININSPITSTDEFKQMFSAKGGEKSYKNIESPSKEILKDANDKINVKNENINDLLNDINLDDSEYDF